MHCLARWPSARKSLTLLGKKETPALAQGPLSLRLLSYLLVVGQVLEIIFTFLTVNVG
jgi:hypothetical protein